jgi:heptosyltransferase-2
MGWKGDLVDIPLGLVSRVLTPRARPLSSSPSIFILRNNDIGDLLVTTPLFEALRRRFPDSEIVAGVGRWNLETLRGNPHLSEVVEVNAPWNNKYVPRQRWSDVLQYLVDSPELSFLRDRFDVGMDVMGSHVGSVLLMRLGIPHRMGVRGYRGGHRTARQSVRYNPDEHVGRSALRFAELLGATDLPEVRPQIFLSGNELTRGEGRWPDRDGMRAKRIALGIGGGFPGKCWPSDRWESLIGFLAPHGWSIALLGGEEDRALGAHLAPLSAGTLRETFAVTSACDAVITNPSMLLHVGAAFHKPTVVVLGNHYPSGAAHDRQWGYPSCVSLGRERTGTYATPSEVLEALSRCSS